MQHVQHRPVQADESLALCNPYLQQRCNVHPHQEEEVFTRESRGESTQHATRATMAPTMEEVETL